MPDDPTLERRTLLRWFAIGAGAAVAAGCSAGGPSGGSGRVTTIPTSGPAPSTTSTSSPAGVPWSTLQRALQGRLVLPGGPTYATDLQLYDPRFDSIRPAAIAYCASAADVQRSIGFAREHDVPLCARSGGHSYAGYSSTRGLVVDVSAMNAVTVNGTQATIGSGARLIDIYSNLNSQGLSIPGGSCPTVGIAGLALGGGIGVVGRAHGLTCDAMTRVQVVTADGRIVTADAANNEDLFWACRGGGGGNFGIATAFDFTTFAAAEVALFTLRFRWTAAADVLPAWMHWIDGAPDALWSNCIVSTGGGAPSISLGGIWIGGQSGVAPLIAQLVAQTGTTPTTNFLETIPLAHAMFVEAGCGQLSVAACHLATRSPQGTLARSASFAASNYVDRVPSDAGIRTILDGIDARARGGHSGAIAFDSYGGTINRVAADATAFVHRNSLCCAQYSVGYEVTEPAAAIATHEEWLAEYGRSLRPYVSAAAYQNYIDPTLADWLHAYYGENLTRLQTVKKRWDPDDTFRFAQSIPPL